MGTKTWTSRQLWSVSSHKRHRIVKRLAMCVGGEECVNIAFVQCRRCYVFCCSLLTGNEQQLHTQHMWVVDTITTMLWDAVIRVNTRYNKCMLRRHRHTTPYRHEFHESKPFGEFVLEPIPTHTNMRSAAEHQYCFDFTVWHEMYRIHNSTCAHTCRSPCVFVRVCVGVCVIDEFNIRYWTMCGGSFARQSRYTR